MIIAMGLVIFHRPDEISAKEISSRLNKGNKDLTGQVGQAEIAKIAEENI